MTLMMLKQYYVGRGKLDQEQLWRFATWLISLI